MYNSFEILHCIWTLQVIDKVLLNKSIGTGETSDRSNLFQLELSCFVSLICGLKQQYTDEKCLVYKRESRWLTVGLRCNLNFKFYIGNYFALIHRASLYKPYSKTVKREL